MPKTAMMATIRPTRANASKLQKAIRRLAIQWGVPSLVDTTVEWSPRLSRSLGRASPQRMRIRLHARLREPGYAALLREVLCHELAHLAVFVLHGRDASPHGPEWRQLVESAGYEPRTGIHIPDLISTGTPATRFQHVCPRCNAKRFAKRQQRSWRCVACRRRGLEGELIIRRCDPPGEVRDG